MTCPTTIYLTLEPEFREIRAYFDASAAPEDVVGEFMYSEDRNAQVIVTAHDGLPLVHMVMFKSDAKYTLLEDWIEEAIAAALGEQYDDNHYKANQLSESE